MAQHHKEDTTMDFWESGGYDPDIPEDLFDNARDPQDGFVDPKQQEDEFDGLSIQEFGMALGFGEEMSLPDSNADAAFDDSLEDVDVDDLVLPLSERHGIQVQSSAFHQWVMDVATGKKTLDDPM
jgi:hypothetical protein